MAKPTRYTPELIEKYYKEGWWDPRTSGDIWDENARNFPEEECLVDSRVRLTWSRAKQWIDRLALGFLRMGLEKDEMLVVQLPNSAELFTLRVACEKAGILCLPVLAAFRHKEMEYLLRQMGAAGVVIPGQFRNFDHFEMIHEIRSTLPSLRHVFVTGDDVPAGSVALAGMLEHPLEDQYPSGYLDGKKCPPTDFSLVLSTSGSTGFPKFVEYPSCSQLRAGRNKIELLNFTQADVFGAFAPGIGPNIPVIYGAPQVAAKVVMMEKFDAEGAFHLIDREKITVAFVVPAMLAKMLIHPGIKRSDLGSLRLIYCTGAALNYELGLEVEEKMGCSVVQFYGSVDGGAATGHRWNEPLKVRLSSVGKPVGGNEVMLADENGRQVPEGKDGEVFMRGPSFVSGYYRDPEATRKVWTEDGWYKTGDLGRFDGQGNLVIVGRKTDCIIRGGQNIYPAEVEKILATHPVVSEVAIIGMPDPVMGERACAYVVPVRGKHLTFEEMVSFLKRNNIASFKLPERLELIEKLPMVSEGQKLDRVALQKDIIRKLKERVQGVKDSRGRADSERTTNT
ncbi:MAG: AMP-binding protein [Desulfobacterales bacterium]|nr:AMP-binding protein [Desulfobacterales bacterium]